MNNQTEIDGNKGINTLQEIADALDNGDQVDAEGEYYIEGGENIVIEMELDVERRDDDEDDDDGENGDDGDDDDEDREEFDFEGAISSVTSTTFTLNGQTFTVNDQTDIDGNKGVNTLQEIADALDNGDQVDAEGEYYIEGGENIVIEMELDVERRDDDEGDDNSDDNDEDDD